MWGLGALRDGARDLVKQGAGAVRHGVEAGAKLLENLDEVRTTVDTSPTCLVSCSLSSFELQIDPNTTSSEDHIGMSPESPWA